LIDLIPQSLDAAAAEWNALEKVANLLI